MGIHLIVLEQNINNLPEPQTLNKFNKIFYYESLRVCVKIHYLYGMIVSQKQINEIKRKLVYGTKGPLAYRLGIKQSALSRYLALKRVYDPITDTYRLGYEMPEEILNGITEYIKTKIK